jgi:hypothetical protein
MPVKSFKFVSPGVFINEIDNSFRPRRPNAIGPVIIGRSVRGLAMQPVKLESYSDFLTMYGDTVPGNGGGDVYRDGNYQSPMYGTYAAKAFLNASVAPVTYVRLLGNQNVNKSTGGEAGWKTTKQANQSGVATQAENGGAFGLFLFPSSSGGPGSPANGEEVAGTSDLGRGVLSAIWYVDQNCSIQLSGNAARTPAADAAALQGVGMVVESDASGHFTAIVKGSKTDGAVDEKFVFNFDDSSERFIRKTFNTNPQLKGADQSFYATSLERNYWLGETFEQEVRDGLRGLLTGSDAGSQVGKKMFGVIWPIQNSSNEGPSQMQGNTEEARTGWFIGQDLGAATSYVPSQVNKLFKLKGRGHGEWLSKNTKVSIEKIRYSNTSTSDYGTFSLVIRSLTDTDANPVVLERFDNLTLDPRSPNYISRKIGDKYYEWNEAERRLREYGEYPNQSKFVYVSDIEEGNIANAPTLLPFGFYGPPKFAGSATISGSVSDAVTGLENTYLNVSTLFGTGSGGIILSGALGRFSGSLEFPTARLRHSASDGGLSDQTDTYFGFQTSRTRTSARPDMSMKDYHRLWLPEGNWSDTDATGVTGNAYIFTMDDIIFTSASGSYYQSGSRTTGESYTAESGKTYKDLIDLGFDQFTAPMWGGFDGFDITKPDPVYNAGMSGVPTELNNYIYNTYKRAIDTVADPEFVDMNLLTVPGLTKDGLTTHMVDVCEARADALALIDLPDVYIPTHEEYYDTLAKRQASTPSQASNALRQRQIDSSYGATFYPWVQTVDEPTGQALWVPPTVAMMGVLASSERSSQIWFAPAGFNRGGLSDGAAGIPVTSVSRRLTSKERDVLYEARINPIASFPSTGIVVFGQKTLQERPSALDRINVRRLVIYLKKQISILSTQILFEQNVQATWNRFKGLIEPFLANVKTQFGITDYRLILDESTTTPDLVDQNVVYAKIMIKPARAIEYIAIDFIVASAGASFDD